MLLFVVLFATKVMKWWLNSWTSYSIIKGTTFDYSYFPCKGRKRVCRKCSLNVEILLGSRLPPSGEPTKLWGMNRTETCSDLWPNSTVVRLIPQHEDKQSSKLRLNQTRHEKLASEGIPFSYVETYSLWTDEFSEPMDETVESAGRIHSSLAASISS